MARREQLEQLSKKFNLPLITIADLIEYRRKHEKLVECLIFFNSGGVTSKTFCLPMNNFFLKLINVIDKILIKLLPNVFASGRQIVLEKI